MAILILTFSVVYHLPLERTDNTRTVDLIAALSRHSLIGPPYRARYVLQPRYFLLSERGQGYRLRSWNTPKFPTLPQRNDTRYSYRIRISVSLQSLQLVQFNLHLLPVCALIQLISRLHSAAESLHRPSSKVGLSKHALSLAHWIFIAPSMALLPLPSASRIPRSSLSIV